MRHYLHPGQLFATNTPSVVTTVLGSCVAVCLLDTRSPVAGMNHYMLPYWSMNGNASPRYGNVAIAQLLKHIVALGADKASLKAKLFGGACVLGTRDNVNSYLGDSNVELARRLLKQEGIPIIAEDVGGSCGRKLVFDTANGSVLVKMIDRL